MAPAPVLGGQWSRAYMMAFVYLPVLSEQPRGESWHLGTDSCTDWPRIDDKGQVGEEKGDLEY
jgi:hypothetical protein